ncbi:MAG: TonB-dependent receptor [Alphaproteobacteria bacterium]|nr:TonB-dependent receptor [Alphaproteobacteria bacterium]
MRRRGDIVRRARRPALDVTLRAHLLAAGIPAALLWPGVARGQDGTVTLPEIRVIGTSPLATPRRAAAAKPRAATASPAPAAPAPATAPPEPAPRPDITAIDRDKVPASTHTVLTEDLDHAKSSSVPETLLRLAPGVSINDTAVNPFQPDIQYRGFVASPTIGTPQGMAIYQNGVRVNEVFGDTVNWDFIPEYAVQRIDLVPNNPVYGLNALGGALSIQMKNGFTWNGAEAEVRGGSFGRRAVTVQAGKQVDNVAGYVAADALNDDGWRDHSQSRLRRLFADFGVRNAETEFHVNYTAASNSFGAAASTPIQLLNQRWTAIYTNPQTYQNQLNFVNATLSHDINDRLNFKGNVYYRGFRQAHVDGNASEVVPCADPSSLCLGADNVPLFSVGGIPVPASVLNGLTPGSIDRTGTTADAFGGSAQLTSTNQIFGHDNHLVVGTSVDHGRVNFRATSELGTIGSDLFITGTGVIVAQPDGTIAPVNLNTRNTYSGFYATDTFDVTSRLSLTAGGRFNLVKIDLEDQLGTALNGSSEFQRFNPVVGVTYKILPQLTAYGGYSESNRVPTPSELACADPQRPCLLDNFLVSDPPLKQVVGRTFEAGLRGNHVFGDKHRLSWTVGLFRTASSDDILSVPSRITGRGVFQNVGTTRRQGLEASAQYAFDRWNISASYNFIDATFRDTITLASPSNPFAVDGLITVMPGNHIPSIPQHRFKVGAEYAVFDNWKIGANLVAVSGQYLRGDESNLNPMLPGYWVVNLNTTYKINPHTEVFRLVQNLFNQRYYTFGAFFDPTQVPSLGLTDPRTLSPGAPLAVYAGLRVKL